MNEEMIEAPIDQLRHAETMLARMLNVLESMQQERQVATLLSTSIGVVSRLMDDLLADREAFMRDAAYCRDASRPRHTLDLHGSSLPNLSCQLTDLQEANRELSERLRDAIARLDGAEQARRRDDPLQPGRLAAATEGPASAALPLVNLPPDGATLREIELEAIVQALTRSYLVQTRAASLLGISERVMSYKCRHVYRDQLRLRGITWGAEPADDESVPAAELADDQPPECAEASPQAVGTAPSPSTGAI